MYHGFHKNVKQSNCFQAVTVYYAMIFKGNQWIYKYFHRSFLGAVLHLLLAVLECLEAL